MRRLIAAALLAALCSACSKAVVIRSKPLGAQVKVDGAVIGKTPATFVDNGSIPRPYLVEISAPGYETTHTTLMQQWNSSCVALSVIGGCFFLIPFVGLAFCGQLPNSAYDFELEAKPGSAPAVPTPDSAPSPSSI